MINMDYFMHSIYSQFKGIDLKSSHRQQLLVLFVMQIILCFSQWCSPYLRHVFGCLVSSWKMPGMGLSLEKMSWICLELEKVRIFIFILNCLVSLISKNFLTTSQIWAVHGINGTEKLVNYGRFITCTTSNIKEC